MYGSRTGYGSYSAMSVSMDIEPSSYLSSRSTDSTCAFPSWPRRTSLSESDAEDRHATSYLSDEDLYLDPFEDDAHSVSSTGSSASPVILSSHAPVITEDDLNEMERVRAARQRDLARFLMNEKERRRQQAAMKRNASRRSSSSGSSSSPRKSPKTKLSAMTPIAEAE